MTINEAINKLRDIKPTQFDNPTLVGWLSEVEQKIFQENIRWHEGTSEIPPWPYDPEQDMDTALLIPEPYSSVYLRYLEAQVDYYSGEYVRYANSMTMYNVALSEYVDWYNRSHMPKQDNYIRI